MEHSKKWEPNVTDSNKISVLCENALPSLTPAEYSTIIRNTVTVHGNIVLAGLTAQVMCLGYYGDIPATHRHLIIDKYTVS